MTGHRGKLKVLVACEFSGVVRDAFIARGHKAVSCDIIPTEKPEGPHIQADIFTALKRTDYDWDLMIAFPECTHLSGAGAPSWAAKQADGRQQQAIDFVLDLYNCRIPKIAIENPQGILNTVWRNPDQTINPFEHGDPFKKRTCLWLKALPKLIPSNTVEPKYHWTSNSTRGGKMADGTRRKSKLPIYKAWMSAQDRARTFQGVADAMADQWGEAVLSTIHHDQNEL